jgi:general secretion pathway protein H
MISRIDVAVMPATGSARRAARGQAPAGIHDFPARAKKSRGWPAFAGHDEAGGFTLIELAVVLAIMGLMLTLVLTHGPMRSATLQTRAAASQVVQGLRSARARAIALNRPVTFSLDLADHTFRIDDATPHTLPAALQLAVLTVAGKASRQRDSGDISFAPDGSSSGGRIELAGNGARVLVGVDWLTGRVSVANAR